MSLSNDKHQAYMQLALEQARLAQQQDEVPVGAILVNANGVIAAAHNAPIAGQDPTAHAEIVAIRRAADSLQNYRLTRATLYVTLEPCMMCVGAILQARIARVIYAAFDTKAGAVTSVFQLFDDYRLTHRVIHQGGVCAEQSQALLKAFFQARRKSKKVIKTENPMRECDVKT